MGAVHSNEVFQADSEGADTKATAWLVGTHDMSANAETGPASGWDSAINRGVSAELLERLARLAEDELRSRRMRAQFLPAELFGEGGWSMLLDLFVSEYHGRKVSTTSACLAADVPSTTALRWLDLLENKGLIQRAPTYRDKRVKYVALTSKARDALCALLRRQLSDVR